MAKVSRLFPQEKMWKIGHNEPVIDVKGKRSKELILQEAGTALLP